MTKGKTLSKNLTFSSVVSVVIGTVLSGGFFLLPGLIIEQVGSTLVIVYLIALLPLIPSLLSMIELSTAMPRSGGLYFMLDRTLGPFIGTIAGFGTWLSQVLKVAFALVGMGAYLMIFLPTIQMETIAIIFVLLLCVLNILGAKKSSFLQTALTVGLVVILLIFIGGGIPEIKSANFTDFFAAEFDPLFSAAGIVFVSYIGVIKVIGLSEEIKNPERNIPKGIFLGLLISVLFYVLGTIVMVGIIPLGDFIGNYTPVATAADFFLGNTGVILVTAAAVFAFLSVANAGILSASRYPLAMSRDHMIPDWFRRTNKKGTPGLGIIITGVFVSIIIISFDAIKIAKLASTFQLFLFSLICFAVIIMRESKIESYDPGFKSPFYPWTQIFGIIISLLLIVEMGTITILFSLGLIIISGIWYHLYVHHRVIRTGAIYNLFERLGQYKYAGFDYELRDMMKKKKPRKEDPFDQIVSASHVIDHEEEIDFDDLVKKVSSKFAEDTNLSIQLLEQEFLDGTRIGATPVVQQIALPHLVLDNIDKPALILVRAKKGIRVLYNNPLTESDDLAYVAVKAAFFLISPKNNPTQHLRILARIASRVEESSFFRTWDNANNEHELKIALISNERILQLKLSVKDETYSLIGSKLGEVDLPSNSLVVWIKRGNRIVIPDGKTILSEDDILTIVGEPESLDQITDQYELIRANFT